MLQGHAPRLPEQNNSIISFTRFGNLREDLLLNIIILDIYIFLVIVLKTYKLETCNTCAIFR